MYLSQSAIALLYLWSFLAGVLLGGVYDCLRLTRLLPGGATPTGLRKKKLPILGVLPPPGKRRATHVLIFFEDFLFCIIAGVTVVLLFYEAFDGMIRIPALLLVAAGFGAFHISFGRLAKRVAGILGFFLEVAVRYICHFAVLPFKRLIGLVQRAGQARQRRARFRYTEHKFKELQKYEERNRDGENKKKAVQPESVGQDFSRGSRGGIDRGVHQQHHAV